MEDAATAEISRTQVWQWLHNRRGILEDGRRVTMALVRQFLQEELERIRKERGEKRFAHGHFAQATQLFEELVSSEALEEFLTLKAYELLDGQPEPAEVSTGAGTLPLKQRAEPSAEPLKRAA
jgi:malate synthase